MERKELLEVREVLKGISYLDWMRVKTIVDQTFESKKNQLEKKLQLEDVDMDEYFIKSFY